MALEGAHRNQRLVPDRQRTHPTNRYNQGFIRHLDRIDNDRPGADREGRLGVQLAEVGIAAARTQDPRRNRDPFQGRLVNRPP